MNGCAAVPPISYGSNETLEGVCSQELIDASAAEETGAVPAYRDSDGVWQYVAPCDVEHYKRFLGETVVTVYVEADDAEEAVTLDRAYEALATAGYEVSTRSDNERIILAVTSSGDDDDAAETLESLRAIVGPDYSVEYTGDGNTSGSGISTDDVRIEVTP